MNFSGGRRGLKKFPISGKILLLVRADKTSFRKLVVVAYLQKYTREKIISEDHLSHPGHTVPFFALSVAFGAAVISAFLRK